jgi:hypothetical protein
MTIDLQAREKHWLSVFIQQPASSKPAKNINEQERILLTVLTLAHIRKPHPRQRTLRWQTASNYSQ